MENNEFNPNWCSAPGDTIIDILHDRCISIHDFARGIYLDLNKTNELLTGDYEIDNALAFTLGLYFGNSEQFWINREKRYRDGLKKGLKRI